jgi:hypothetical protein
MDKDNTQVMASDWALKARKTEDMLLVQYCGFEFPCHYANLAVKHHHQLQIFHFQQFAPHFGIYFDVLVEGHHQFLQF